MLAVNPQTFGTLADLEVKDGSLDDLAGAGTIAVYDQTAEDKGWSIGDTVPVVFPATGRPGAAGRSPPSASRTSGAPT